MAIHTYKVTRNFYFIFRKLHAVTGSLHEAMIVDNINRK